MGAHKKTKSVPMQRGVRFFCAEAFSCSVALVLGFLTFPWGVQHGLSEGVRNMYKTTVFLHILKTNRKRMVRQKRRQKTKNFKFRWKNQYFEHSLWALFGAHLGCSIFWRAQLGCFQWASNKRQKQFKINGLGFLFRTLLGRPIWTIPTKNTFPCSAALVFGFLMFPWVVQHGPG